jgi:phosphatidylglycerophosphate synthase
VVRAIFESAFDIAYLVTIFTLGVLILRSGPALRGDVTARLAGWIAIILGFGDSFHLIARVWALNTTGVEDHYVSLGYGKLVTALTMTAFYVLVYLLILKRWPTQRELATQGSPRQIGSNPVLSVVVYAAGIVHILLALLPQNETFSPNPSVAWGVLRNAPFLVLGVVVIALLWRRARQDQYYRGAWLAVTLSYAFYIPVVLWAQRNDSVGLLMIPKTLAYVWLVVMGYRAFATRRATVTAARVPEPAQPV